MNSDGKKNRHQQRSYRTLLRDQDLVSFQVAVKETDLYIKARKDLQEKARESVIRYRYQMEQYIARHSEFLSSLTPLPLDPFASPIIREMMQAARQAGVGPMAAVAGAMAEFVGRDLLTESEEVVVENGGDIFLQSSREMRVAIFAGESPLNFRVGLRVPAANRGLGVCTSSATVGPSLSFGETDAVTVLSPSAAVADAAATAIGNTVLSPADLPQGLERAQMISGVTGVVIIIGKKLGAWGEVELLKI